MAKKSINEKPRTTDTISFILETPDADGCFYDNPYKVNWITIYYVERDYLGQNYGEYEKSYWIDGLVEKSRKADLDYCDSPTKENKLLADSYKAELLSTLTKETFYYKDRRPVDIIGTVANPAWLSTDRENSVLRNFENGYITDASNTSPIVITSKDHRLEEGDTVEIKDVSGNTSANGVFRISPINDNQFSIDPSSGNENYSSGGSWAKQDKDGHALWGRFEFEWTPKPRVREGDFFLCYKWQPLPAGDKIDGHIPFTLLGDPRATVSSPAHVTPEDKYELLLERYLPEMYKQYISDGDLTPETTDKFNKAVAGGFTVLENTGNSIIDLFDANALHESLLVYLSNLFNLKLKSGDPTLWRRQIKRAIPNFKKKGTLSGLKESFAMSGMTLENLVQFWQVVPRYTHEESFEIKDSVTFKLEKCPILPIDLDHFKLYIRENSKKEYVEHSIDYINFSEDEDACGTVCYMKWIGDQLSGNPKSLAEGDIVRVRYQFKKIPGEAEKQIEDYISLLPLADTRDETKQDFPLKNWNVKLIEEKDPLFDVIVPVRHPFQDLLIFGQIRTEFPYSENIYNMEEYNGSTRDSTDPCFIDKEFLDPCGSCISSKIAVDISVEEISDDRILEAQDILKEYTPFHAVVHAMNILGKVEEFIQPPEETIESYITFSYSDFVLSGEANPFFHRVLEDGLLTDPDATGYFGRVDRNELATENVIISGVQGNAHNDHIRFIAPHVDLSKRGIVESTDLHPTRNNILEVLSPSANSGIYRLIDINKNTAKLSGGFEGAFGLVGEPLDQGSFTFNLSNVRYSGSTAIITQSNVFKFNDLSVDFSKMSTKSSWDVDNTPNYSGGAWKILIPAYSSTGYTIKEVLPACASMEAGYSNLLLEDNGTLPTNSALTSLIEYSLIDDQGSVIATGTTGNLLLNYRGLVDINAPEFDTIKFLVDIGNFLYYSDNEYEINELNGNKFYINNYNLGDASGVNVEIRQKLVDKSTGSFGYSGLILQSASDHESELEIIGGKKFPIFSTNVDENIPVSENYKDDSLFKENYLIQIDSNYYKIAYIDGNRITLAGKPADWRTYMAGGTTVEYSVIHFKKDLVSIKFTVFDHLDRDGQDVITRTITTDSGSAIVALESDSDDIQENVNQEEEVTFQIETKNGEIEEGEL